MFDNAILTVKAGDLRFRFVQDRGEQGVDVAPLHEPQAWEPLDFALMVADSMSEWLSCAPLQEVADVLKSRIVSLGYAFSRQEYDATSRRLAEIHDRERRQCVTNFNNQR